MRENKLNVVFVGAFKKTTKSGGTGGQTYACSTIVSSKLKNFINWKTIDTTAESNVHNPLYKRIGKALKRVSILLKYLIFEKVSHVLIFTADGASFLEKGTMALISKTFNKKVILAPRSGFIINDLAKKNKRNFIVHVFKKTDIVICQSTYWKQVFTAAYNSPSNNKFVVIKNWINFDAYNSVGKANLERYRNPNTTVLQVLFIGWVDKEKGILDLINAAKILSKKTLPCFKFVIAGNGKEFDEANQMVRECQIEHYFEFKGWVIGDVKMHLLRAADIFVLPSYFEGSPNALLEAMGCAIPSISTSVGAIPDIIENGVNGFINKPGDIEALAVSIEKLIEDQNMRIEMAQKAFDSIRKEHDVINATERFYEIFFKS